METRKIRIELSKRGIPCLWEDGGGYSNTGDSTIIADMHGNPKKPIYICRSGHLSCGQHALIPVRVNDLVIEASHHRRDFSIAISKIVSIDKAEKLIELEEINSFDRGEWGKDLAEKLEKAVNAAMKKATCYHCRSPYYVIEED